MDFNSYAYDHDLAESGKRIDLGDGAYLQICRWGNKRFLARFTELTKPYGNAQAFGKFRQADTEMSEEEMAEVMYRLIAETILVDWGKMTDEGKPLKYSVDNAIKIFKKHEKFMQDVIVQAQDDSNFRAAQMDAELGNSEPSSEASSE